MGSILVREARKRRGLTQRQLAERLGTTQSAVARLEHGSNAPSFDRVLSILHKLDLDLDLMLVERDTSDWVLAAAQLRLTPEERATKHEQLTAFFTEAREAVVAQQRKAHVSATQPA